MRKCIRCSVEMIEDLELKIKGSGMKMAVSKEGTFFGSYPLAEIKLTVCPECGYTETYIKDTATIKQLVLKKTSNID